MPVLPFQKAREQHAMLARWVTYRNEDVARQIYTAVTKAGTPTDLSHAVTDTMPTEYAVLLVTNDVAAAAATKLLVEAFDRNPAPWTHASARTIASEGWQKFRDLAESAATLVAGIGADLSDAWPLIVHVEALRLDKNEITKIAALAGRMLEALRGAVQRRAARLPEDVLGVEHGNDVTALIPQEYALLAVQATKHDTIRRIAERKAEQFERRGREKTDRGALVIVLDESWSMRGGGREQRNIWAKSVATALTRLAWEGNRPVAWVHFSTGSRHTVLMPGDHKKLLEAQTSFLAGGTDIPRGIRRAADLVHDLGRQNAFFATADVVLVSDGNTDSDTVADIPGALVALAGVGARLWSVAIEVDWMRDGSTGKPFAEKAARYVHLSDADMQNPKGAAKLAGALA